MQYHVEGKVGDAGSHQIPPELHINIGVMHKTTGRACTLTSAYEGFNLRTKRYYFLENRDQDDGNSPEMRLPEDSSTYKVFSGDIDLPSSFGEEGGSPHILDVFLLGNNTVKLSEENSHGVTLNISEVRFGPIFNLTQNSVSSKLTLKIIFLASTYTILK